MLSCRNLADCRGFSGAYICWCSCGTSGGEPGGIDKGSSGVGTESGPGCGMPVGSAGGGISGGIGGWVGSGFGSLGGEAIEGATISVQAERIFQLLLGHLRSIGDVAALALGL